MEAMRRKAPKIIHTSALSARSPLHPFLLPFVLSWIRFWICSWLHAAAATAIAQQWPTPNASYC